MTKHSLPYEISPRVELQASTRPYTREPGAPKTRPLRIYTLDPSVSQRTGGVATVDVPYEALAPGPAGTLFAVECEHDTPPAPLTASPLDLDQPNLLLQDGLPPSPGNGQFHLQMTYAVCSLTYAAFRRALGRDIAWACGVPGPRAPLRSAVDVAGIAAFDADGNAGGRHGPKAYHANREAHDLGSVLVSAVFEAFATIFRRKSERILEIAGVSDASALHLPGAVVRALAELASEIAGQFLNVCIRAIDYCPPVDMELGEYLRALATAYAEVVPDDKWGYREALMRSFRRRQLFPDHVEFMSEDAVKWGAPDEPIVIPELAFSRLRF